MWNGTEYNPPKISVYPIWVVNLSNHEEFLEYGFWTSEEWRMANANRLPSDWFVLYWFAVPSPFD